MKPRLLVVSHVNPLPRQSGQQQRVHYTLVALGKHFHVTFVGFAEAASTESNRKQLLQFCDEVELFPSIYSRNVISRLWHRGAGWLYQRSTGLKFSNYVIGKVELAPERIARIVAGRKFDLALFEYFHAAHSAALLRRGGIPCVLDMHNILWQSFSRQLETQGVENEKRQRAVARYRAGEESSWAEFDALIAISMGEHDYVRPRLRLDQQLFYAPMGIPLGDWPYCWSPAQPPRLAYYGGLGSAHNARDARRCCETIMPAIWSKIPNAELWLVGSNPPSELRALAQHDQRVKVTGFVNCVQEVLKTMSVVLCPFKGTYGFRSRLVEAMALGVPVVASPDAVSGMGLVENRGLFLAETDKAFADAAMRLLTDAGFAQVQSRNARIQIEEHYSFEQSYGRLARELLRFFQDPNGVARVLKNKMPPRNHGAPQEVVS